MEERSAHIRAVLGRLKPEHFWRGIERRAKEHPAFAALASHLRVLDGRRSPRANDIERIAADIEGVLRQGPPEAPAGDGSLAEAAEVVAAKAAVRLVENVFAAIVAETLRAGDEMAYWEDQAALPAVFFMQDVPIRLAAALASGAHDWQKVRYLPADSRAHIQRRLDAARGLRDRHARCLGLLAELHENAARGPALQVVRECVRLLRVVVAEVAGTSGTVEAEPPSDVRALAEELVRLARTAMSLRTRLADLTAECARPPAWERYWLPVAVVVGASYMSVSRAIVRRHDIERYVSALRDSAMNIVREWIVRPVMHIYSIVRYDRSEIALLGARSLQSDVESLERMVTDYARDVLALSPAQLDAVGRAAREGDLSPVMEGYERDIRSPVKALVLGTMLRTLLIQVQKSKVDIEKAMASLDKIMRANELNFELLATIPALWAMRFAFVRARDFLRKRSGLRSKSFHDRMRLVLRDAERMVNTAGVLDPVKAHVEVEGHILILCHELRVLARDLPRGEVRRIFLQDVRDVELLRGDADRRVRVFERMARTHAFLQPVEP